MDSQETMDLPTLFTVCSILVRTRKGYSNMVTEMGTFLHACEGEIVCESVNTKIPYFNAPIYLENKVGFNYPASTSYALVLTII